MLQLRNLNVSIGGSRILRDVSLEVPPHEVVCLMGRNGVGKTTTLKTIVGLRKQSSGAISLGGADISSAGTSRRVRLGIGYVPQGRDIFPTLTVLENLKIGALAHGHRLNGQLERVYGLFPVLKDMPARKGGVLSGGQQQQLAIGRALLTNPQVLLLDEPTEGIQPNVVDQIGDTIKRLRHKGIGQAEVEQIGSAIKAIRKDRSIGILLVEQYLDFCLDVGDSFYIMDRGSIVAEGPITDLNQDIVKQHLTV